MNEVIDCHVMNKLSEGSRTEYIMHINQTKKSGAKIHMYQTINEVFSLLRRNMPLSIIKNTEGGYYIVPCEKFQCYRLSNIGINVKPYNINQYIALYNLQYSN